MPGSLRPPRQPTRVSVFLLLLPPLYCPLDSFLLVFVCRPQAAGRADHDGTDSEGDGDAATVSNVSNGGAPPQSIASQLDALAEQEDLLLQQYQADMRYLDEVHM